MGAATGVFGAGMGAFDATFGDGAAAGLCFAAGAAGRENLGGVERSLIVFDGFANFASAAEFSSFVGLAVFSADGAGTERGGAGNSDVGGTFGTFNFGAGKGGGAGFFATGAGNGFSGGGKSRSTRRGSLDLSILP